MNRRIVLTTLLVSFLVCALFSVSKTQVANASGAVGVKTGDWIRCTYTISGWPSGTPYPEWLGVEFLTVDGTNAAVRVTLHLSDRTEQNETMSVDVVAGGGSFQGLSGFVIPANCTTGDSIYMSRYGDVTIAGETIGTYAGAARTVVYAGFSRYGTQLTYYWDKQTGVMLESSETSGTMTGTARATETNMWQAKTCKILVDPPFATFAVGEACLCSVAVTDVVDLIAWQVALKYNGSVLNLDAVWVPEDNVFDNLGQLSPEPVFGKDVLDGLDYVVFGNSLFTDSVNSSAGVLFRANFTSLHNGETSITIATKTNRVHRTENEYDAYYSYLLDWNLGDISFTVEDCQVAVGTSFRFLTITKSGSGTTFPAIGFHPYVTDSNVSVWAVPEFGFDFDRWKLDGIDLGSENPLFVLMNTNHTLQAIFPAHTPATWTVDDDGPSDFHLIQDAVDSPLVTAGDTILVKPGTYHEHIYVPKNLTIVGEDRDTTIIDGGGTGTVVFALAEIQTLLLPNNETVYYSSGLTALKGFTVRNGEYGIKLANLITSPPGVDLPGGYIPCNIEGNQIIDNSIGGMLLGFSVEGYPGSGLNRISNNFVGNNSLFGIFFPETAVNNTLLNNTIVNNECGIALSFQNGAPRGNVLRNNRMNNNRYNFGFLVTSSLYYYSATSPNDIDASNTVNGKPIYCWVDVHDRQVPSDAGYVFLYNCTNITVSGCNLTDNLQGLFILQSNNTQVLNNEISENVWGVYLGPKSNNNTLKGNSIRANIHGVYLGGFSRHTTMKNNSIDNCQMSFGLNPAGPHPFTWEIENGFNLEESDLTNDIDNSNTVDGKPIVYWTNQHGLQVPSNAGYVMLINSTDIVVQGLDLSNNIQNIFIFGSGNIVIVNNSITNSPWGIRINELGWDYGGHSALYSSNITVEGNMLVGNGVGMLFRSAVNCRVSDNLLFNNSLGILLRNTDDSSIIGNLVVASDLYAQFHSPYYYFIFPEENWWWSRELVQVEIGGIISSGTRNTISSNTVENCAWGISMSDYTASYFGSYNVVYGNCLINNFPYQAMGAMGRPPSFDTSNTWDNGHEGNYWSDYNGTDSNGDGVGETPYYGLGVVDRYPLMNPVVPFGLSILGVVPSRTIVRHGMLVQVDVTIAEDRNVTGAFNVTLYVGSTPVQTQLVSLSDGEETLRFVWNTSGLANGRYVLVVYAESNIDGKMGRAGYGGGNVYVTGIGDLSSVSGFPDGRVDMRDISYVARRFTCVPEGLLWNSNADVNGDGKIDMKDIGAVARHFGEHYP